MTRLGLSYFVALLLCTSISAQDSSRPVVINAKFETRGLSGDLSSALRSNTPAWFGYAIKAAPGRGDSWSGRNGCELETHSSGSSAATTRPVELEGSTPLAILFRVDQNHVEKIRIYSLRCPLDAGGLSFIWLTGVSTHASLDYLKGLSSSSSNRLANNALLAISRHDGVDATGTLISLAKFDPSSHVRGQALFWLAQRADKQSASAITDAIDNDPDTKVKRQAVFALSQLPKNESVPKLIEIARSQKNLEVRRQAFFWLGQSQDPRALAFFEDVLNK